MKAKEGPHSPESYCQKPGVPDTLNSRKQGMIHQRQNGRWLAISALPRVTVNCNQPSWLMRRDELSTLKKGCKGCKGRKGCAEKAGVAAWKAGKVQSPGWEREMEGEAAWKGYIGKGKGARRLNLIETYKQAAPRITRFPKTIVQRQIPQGLLCKGGRLRKHRMRA